MEFILPHGWLFLWILAVCIAWETVWKLIAFWKAARNNHLGWFICIALVNSVGILPIVYILMQKKIDKVENPH